MRYHLKSKLPGNISKPHFGSHTNVQNYSGEKKRKSGAERTEQTTFSQYFNAEEFCSSQLLLKSHFDRACEKGKNI